MQNQTLSFANSEQYFVDETYQFQFATLLDLPFIFELMMDGSEQGAFTEKFLGGKGGVNLFAYITFGILSKWKWNTKKELRPSWILIKQAESVIGFMNIQTLQLQNDRPTKILGVFAVSPIHRGQGHAVGALRQLIGSQPSGTTLLVHCTKYARGMQHVLKTVGFRRNRRASHPAEEYWLHI